MSELVRSRLMVDSPEYAQRVLAETDAIDREKLLELLDEKKRQYNFWRAR